MGQGEKQYNGNVGIGTTSPNATLNVRGGVNVTGSVNLATLEGNVGIGTTSPKGLTELAYTADTDSYGNYSEIKKLWRSSFGAITDTNWYTTTSITLNSKGFGGVTIEYFVKVITYDSSNTYGTFYRKWVAGRDNNNGGMLTPTLIDTGNSNDAESAVDVQITTSGTPDNTLLLQVRQTANHGGLSSFNYVRIIGVDIDSVSYS